MKARENILLKLLTLGITFLYIWSMLWVSVTYGYAIPYALVKELGMGTVIDVKVLVILISIIALGLILFKLKGHTFWKLLMQDFILVIISCPFFSIILGYVNAGFSDPTNPNLRYAGMFLFTILTANLNDWIKAVKPGIRKA
jgi:hypothetical protein